MTIQQFISAMFEKWSHRHRFVKIYEGNVYNTVKLVFRGDYITRRGIKFVYLCEECGKVKIVKVEAD